MGIRRHGFAVIKRALKAREVDALANVIADSFRAYVPEPGTPFAAGYELNRWICIGDLSAQIGRNAQLEGIIARLVSLAEWRTFKFNGLFCPECSFIKRIEPERYATAKIAWHRDADAGGTARYADCVNVWVPVCHVGRTRPSLQFVTSSHKTMRRIPTTFDKNGTYEVIDDGFLATHFGNYHVATPVMAPGDVVLFDHHVLHRTQPMTGHPEERGSLECRVRFESVTR